MKWSWRQYPDLHKNTLIPTFKLNPEIMIDSMGYSFTYPLFRLCGSKVGCYIHYPTISTDMLNKVKNRGDSFNNDSRIAKSTILTNAKVSFIISNIFKAKNNLNRKPFWGIDFQSILYNIDWKHFLRRFCLFSHQVSISRTNFYGVSAGQST